MAQLLLPASHPSTTPTNLAEALAPVDAWIQAVQMEELGHAIDTRLNGSHESPGDEGQIVSALLRGGKQPTAASLSQNDQHTQNLEGQVLAIKAADTSAPVALTTNPAYAAAATNAFGLADVGFSASPELVDIDGDGDLDAFIGNNAGNTRFFRNTAAAGSSNPAYAPATTSSPFGLADARYYASPELVDIDGDGDLDAFINTLFFRNTAATGSTNPAYAVAATNPFGLAVASAYASPELVDIDADGDLDAFIGDVYGNTFFFRNTAAAGSTNPAYAAATTNPFGLADVDFYASPELVDIDGDGDLDAFIGDRWGNTLFFRNTAAAGSTSPAAAAAAANPFGLTDVDAYASPSFVDIDGDGDLDAFIGRWDGITLFFRNIAPALGVSSTTANGSYGVGAVINLTLTFSEPVLVTGAPQLQLETGSTDRYAVYSAGSGSSTLTFTYTVQAGDSAADLDLLSANALSLNGGTIKDAAGNNAVLTLAAPGAPASLAARTNLVIEARAFVTGVTSPTANGSYGVGAVINLTVTYSQAVLVTGTPQLQLETGSTARFATYSSGSGTSTLNFSYTVQAGDSSADLDLISTNALSLNGGTIKDVAFGNNASLAVPALGAPGSLGVNKNLLIETTPPVALTTPPANPAYAAAATNAFGLGDVGYVARPALGDIDGDGDLDAFIGNNYGNTLFFRNTAAAGNSTPAYVAAATNPFGLTDVGGSASPSFVDIDGDGDLDAFIGNSSGNTLFFRNTAAAGSTSPTYAAAATNPFGLANVGRYANPNLVDIDVDGDLDAFIGEHVGNTLFFRNTAAAGSTNPAYAPATTNPFGLANVGRYASPELVDIDGDGDLDAFIGEFSGNFHGTTRFFLNTAAAGSTSPAFAAATTNPFGLDDVDDIPSPSFIDIDGDGDLDAFIGDGIGNTLFFRNTAPALGVSSTTANGSYGVGAVINLTLTFSEPVLVTGAPQLQLETGSTDRYAVYNAGSGSSTLTFTYTVQAGDGTADLDLLSANALSLNGGSIKDAAGNNAVLTLAAPGSLASLAARKSLAIAGALVTGVTSPTANGSYGVGAEINLTVTYSQAVLVTGTPQLQLETGSTDRFAIYTGGSGTSTLTFSFTVQPGDNATDLDVLSSSALSLNGGTIKDVAFGNNASLSLAAPGASGSLWANKNLVIDTSGPVALSTTPVFAAAATNPFGLTNVGFYASPELVDIDADGDLDAFMGDYHHNTLFFRNTAGADSTNPSYADGATNRFGLGAVGLRANPELVDIDGDGDFDAFIGDHYGNALFFRNTAAAGSTSPTYAAAASNPFGLADVGFNASPSFVDIDGDGDLDAFIGNSAGDTLFFRNIAGAGSASPAYAAAATNPFGLATVGISASPELVDIDGDGDLDAFIGNSAGDTLFFLNTAGAGSSSPAYTAAATNPFGLATVGISASPSFADIDGDGDLDAFIGNGAGNTHFFRNTAPAPGVSSTTANGSYGVGAVINLTLTFSESVLVTGAPQLQLETGSNDRYAVYSSGSGSSTLIFSYTVQVGDRSADLDLLSANALSLNGGTIKDAAGNNAVLSLAAPGSPASLAARKNLVIKNDATPPVITAGPTAIGLSGISVTSNESGSAALYKVDNTQLFPTALAANTAAALTLAAQAAITTATLKVADADGNLTAAAPTFLLGTDGADGIAGTAAADFLYGFSGNDSLSGGKGNDTFIGGDGIDRVVEEADVNVTLSDTQLTGLGTDTLDSMERASLTGGLSDNTLDASAFSRGAVWLNGGAGNDLLIGPLSAGSDYSHHIFTGGGGDDTFSGGDGFDGILEEGDVNFTLLSSQLIGRGTDGFSSMEFSHLIGGAGNNRLNAEGFTGSLTFLEGAGGNDTLIGGAAFDWVVARGNTNFILTDTQQTGLGTDTLTKIDGARLNGGAGGNVLDVSAFTGRCTVLEGGGGNDTLIGGASIDWVVARGDANFTLSDTQLTGLGTDTLSKMDGARLNGGAGNNVLDVSAFTGRYTVLEGREGNDTLIGRAVGIDQVTAHGDVDFTLSDTQLTGLGTDTLVAIDEAKLIGDGSDNRLDASGFTRGRVFLYGESGKDTLKGGSGNDVLSGGVGDDSLFGGAGTDRLEARGDTNFTLTATQLTGLGTDTFESIEHACLCGGPSDNILEASGFNGSLLILEGQGGDDTLIGRTAGIDRVRARGDVDFTLTNTQLLGLGTDVLNDIDEAELIGNSGDNSFDASAFSLGSVTLGGGSGQDTLKGGAGNDVLLGGYGDDVLAGGIGKDRLTGGQGQDLFTWMTLEESLLSSFDVITDYQGTGVGPDRLDLPAASLAGTLTSLSGTITDLSEVAIQGLLTSFGAHQVSAFKVTGMAGTFICVNDGTNGFQANSDAIVQLLGYTVGVSTPVLLS